MLKVKIISLEYKYIATLLLCVYEGVYVCVVTGT